jgi:hypothetical protein
LVPTGTLVISTPNREVFSPDGCHNRFHCSELSEAEFCALLKRRFGCVQLFSQSPRTARPWSSRSLAASRSVWTGVRGFWALRRFLSSGTSVNKREAEWRSDPAGAVNGKDSVLSSLANPYLVRRRSKISGELPLYLLGVCGRPMASAT